MHMFDRMTQQASQWVKEMMAELGTDDPDKALHALRAGLQAMRDRLSVEEAAQLSAQLPAVLRGIFFEGWEPTGKPLRIRHRSDFLALVRQRYGRDDAAANDILRATMRVMERHISTGEISDIMLSLPNELVDLISPHERDD
jgi:uncharacterized protein (DUF2267 family)